MGGLFGASDNSTLVLVNWLDKRWQTERLSNIQKESNTRVSYFISRYGRNVYFHPVTDIGGKEVSATISVTIIQLPASNEEYLYWIGTTI